MHDKLREIRLAPYRKGQGPRFMLRTFDTGRTNHMGKSILAYEFRQNGKLLFSGEDFCCSPMDAIDSDVACAALLGFITLRPGDTDAEYFANYTPAQMAFAESHAEILSAEVYARFGLD